MPFPSALSLFSLYSLYAPPFLALAALIIVYLAVIEGELLKRRRLQASVERNQRLAPAHPPTERDRERERKRKESSFER